MAFCLRMRHSVLLVSKRAIPTFLPRNSAAFKVEKVGIDSRFKIIDTSLHFDTIPPDIKNILGTVPGLDLVSLESWLKQSGLE